MTTKFSAFLAFLMACGLAVCTASAQEPIVYVDATHGSAGNTALAPSAGGGVFDPTDAEPDVNGLWTLRNGFGNSATVYQSAFDGSSDRLETTASVPNGIYDVYAYIWSDTSIFGDPPGPNGWRAGASLTDDAGDLPLFVAGDHTVAGSGITVLYETDLTTNLGAAVFSSALSPNPFTSDVMIAEGNRRLYQISLGQVTGDSISVFIGNDPSISGESQRTWYDGIGYSLIPEPTSLCLFSLGMGVAVLMRRRV